MNLIGAASVATRVMSTVILAHGPSLAHDVWLPWWHSIARDDHLYGTAGEVDVMGVAFWAAHVAEVNALLPAGCRWEWRAAAITGPAGTDLDAALEEAAGREGATVQDVVELGATEVLEEQADALELRVIGRLADGHFFDDLG